MKKLKIMSLIIAASLSLTGCGIDTMTPTQQALLAGGAAAAVGGIAYGVHEKHEADKAKHKKKSKYSEYNHGDENDRCYDDYGSWQC